MLGPYHQGDTVHVHLWNGEAFTPVGTFIVTDKRCAEPREEPKGFNVYQTHYRNTIPWGESTISGRAR